MVAPYERAQLGVIVSLSGEGPMNLRPGAGMVERN